MYEWQQGSISGDDFTEQLTTKTRMFFRSMNRQERLRNKREERVGDLVLVNQ